MKRMTLTEIEEEALLKLHMTNQNPNMPCNICGEAGKQLMPFGVNRTLVCFDCAQATPEGRVNAFKIAAKDVGWDLSRMPDGMIQAMADLVADLTKVLGDE